MDCKNLFWQQFFRVLWSCADDSCMTFFLLCSLDKKHNDNVVLQLFDNFSELTILHLHICYHNSECISVHAILVLAASYTNPIYMTRFIATGKKKGM